MSDNAKTYDGLTGRFLANVATCMPKLSASRIQEWNEDPKGLKMALSQALGAGYEMSSHRSSTSNLPLTSIFDHRWRCRIDETVALAAPRRAANKGVIYYFREENPLSNDGLAEKYMERGMIPADPFFFAASNADTWIGPRTPCATVWQDAQGKWCAISLQRADPMPLAMIGRSENDWPPGWLFAGEYE